MTARRTLIDVFDRLDTRAAPIQNGLRAVSGRRGGGLLMRAMTEAGTHGALVLLLSNLDRGADRRRRAMTSVALAAAVGESVKVIVGRPRPAGATLRTRSWPSTHSATSIAAAHALSRRQPAAVRTGLYGLAAGVCLSRVSLGVHHPTDVLAGALLGLVLASCVEELNRTTRDPRPVVVWSL